MYDLDIVDEADLAPVIDELMAFEAFAAFAPDTLAVGVGAFKPDMVEFPAALLHSRQIVVDDLAGARHEAGDLIQAGIDWSQVRELAGMLDQPPPTGAGSLPVFKTVGQAAWDLAAARVALMSLASPAPLQHPQSGGVPPAL